MLSDAVSMGLSSDGFLGGQLGEFLDGILLEDVAVLGEFISDVGDLGLDESGSGVVGEGTSDVLSEDSNDLEGFLMVSNGLNEESIGETSHVLELFSSSCDLGKSVVGPVDPAVGILDLLFNVLSVDSGVFKVVLVDVGDLSDFSDGSLSDFFVSGVLLVSSNLNVQVFGLEISEEIVNGFHGIIGSGSGLDKGGELCQVEG